MEKTKYPSRKRNRLQGFDYASYGVYFITICVNQKRSILARIGTKNDNIDYTLTQIGECVKACILGIEEHYPEVVLENYCIMPDHVHLLLGKIFDNGKNQKKDISTIVGQLKRISTKLLGINIWQRSFYDEIIDRPNVYEKVYDYISANPYVLEDIQERDCYFSHMIKSTPPKK